MQRKSDEGQSAVQKIKRASKNLQDSTRKRLKMPSCDKKRNLGKKFTKKLKRNTAALIDEVDRKHNEVNQKLVKQHDDMKAYVEKVNGSLKFAKNIIEKGSNEEIITLGDEVKSNANNIEKEPQSQCRQFTMAFLNTSEKKSTKNIVDILDLKDLGEIGKFY